MDFQQIFNDSPEVWASAPGRVNLLGEHTDYNDGFVLPTAIPQQTTVYIGISPNPRHHFYSVELAAQVDVAPTDPVSSGFGRYIFGCIQVLEKLGHKVPPLNVLVTSTVPIGSGLSSSAALEIATLKALRSLLELDLDPVQLAQLGQQAEIEYAGVQCGIMDQMAASLADTKHLLFLDTRTLERRLLPLPAESEILVIDSGIPRTLADSGYNQRRAECEAAAQILKVPALRDVTDVNQVETLPSPLQQRARHVITENNRVLEASQGVSAQRFGELMNASHQSLRDDYEVSVAGLDHLVDLLQNTPAVWGARLTGAGFGGACVALVKPGEARTIGQMILQQYNADNQASNQTGNQTEHKGRILVPDEI
ncbi:galactokinase [Leptolyngbya sp. NK1-12]|uniref:Galactokinase n=1 Tax=Leptolyngbya sp. NK1-12 TaxID=2547451 RepID=A0AA96WKP7_9CYAN|nr:galactokinase [Leptolyngbya sp. NK1-12]WNZ27193.1 galactokinase [Leptolyngbya sp. NK1-12]